jgi:biotin-(acetyl-CoA carboxylase) ligase
MKFGLGVNATFQSTSTNDLVTNTISTKHQAVNSSSQIPRVVDSLIEDLLNRFEHINHKGSGCTAKKINPVFLKS